MLEQSIATLRGIGAARLAAFERLQVKTLRDLLFLLPRDYLDYSQYKSIANTQHGESVALHLTILTEPKLLRPSRGLQMVTANAEDETGRLQIVWFNQPYRKNQISVGETRTFCGRIDKSKGLRLVNPEIAAALPGIRPVYPLVSGLSQRNIRDAVTQALSLCLDQLEDDFSPAFRETYTLCDLRFAIHNLHAPADMESLLQARYRLSFEDMLYYLLAIALLKKERQGKTGISFETTEAKTLFLQSLSFSLTGAQQRVINEISADMQSSQPMNRLVQGDVGSGKTVLAFFALRVAVENGYQGALMAPTEILARQHYALLDRQFGAQACLVHGGMRKAEREDVYARILNGDAKYIVGTHALLQEPLRFHRLGVVITDEQHRFGVRQRALISDKSDTVPDVLIMSATPIPRTLSMLLYGDLDLSVVDELPPGRKPVQTRIVAETKREAMYQFIQNQAKEGKQAYVVCPLVEQSEQIQAKSAQEVYSELIARLPAMRIALLHGRMAGAKKDAAIQAFRDGLIDILVSTTVVEVGVDVPNATIMVIESAERFGLAQLHQLRGRVGRGADISYCFLLSSPHFDTASARMEIMTQTNDGFVIAQRDLELRGPGEFLGTKQHGTADLQIAKLATNMDVLFAAQIASGALIDEGNTPENTKIYLRAQALYETRMRYIANN